MKMSTVVPLVVGGALLFAASKPGQSFIGSTTNAAVDNLITQLAKRTNEVAVATIKQGYREASNIGASFIPDYKMTWKDLNIQMPSIDVQRLTSPQTWVDVFLYPFSAASRLFT
jgi:hypothetical protein